MNQVKLTKSGGSQSVSADLATFIRERGLVSLDDMVNCAESYRLARPGKNLARKASTYAFASVGQFNTVAEGNATSGRSDFRGGYGSYRRQVGYRGRWNFNIYI